MAGTFLRSSIRFLSGHSAGADDVPGAALHPGESTRRGPGGLVARSGGGLGGAQTTNSKNGSVNEKTAEGSSTRK